MHLKQCYIKYAKLAVCAKMPKLKKTRSTDSEPEHVGLVVYTKEDIFYVLLHVREYIFLSLSIRLIIGKEISSSDGKTNHCT
jgi:hypothetical protein